MCGRSRGAGYSMVVMPVLHASWVIAVWSLPLMLELLLVVEGCSTWRDWSGGRRMQVGVCRSETSQPAMLQDQSSTASRWCRCLMLMSCKCEVVWRTKQKEQTKFQQERSLENTPLFKSLPLHVSLGTPHECHCTGRVEHGSNSPMAAQANSKLPLCTRPQW